MTKMERVPALQQQSRDGSVFLSSPKWLQVVPPPSLGRQSLRSKQFQKVPLKSVCQTLTSHQHPAKLPLQQPLKDFSLQGDGGVQKRASNPTCNLNPPSSLLIVQSLLLFLLLRTRKNKPIYLQTVANIQKACQTVKLKKLLPGCEIKSHHLYQTKKLMRFLRKPRPSCPLRAGLQCHKQRSL